MGTASGNAIQHLRWLLEIDYSTENGTVTIDHHIEEIADAHALVEAGPDWNSIKEIRIKLNPHRRSYHVTVEQAENL